MNKVFVRNAIVPMPTGQGDNESKLLSPFEDGLYGNRKNKYGSTSYFLNSVCYCLVCVCMFGVFFLEYGVFSFFDFIVFLLFVFSFLSSFSLVFSFI